MKKQLTKNQIRRLPDYLSYLLTVKENNQKTITTQKIAQDLGLNVELVKKDIQNFSSLNGVPNKGRDVDQLIEDLKLVLGSGENHRAILVGVGSLGRAILRYDGFKEFNLTIVGAFDHNKEKIGKEINGIPIFDIDDLVEKRRKLDASIGIICVPKEVAQGIAIRLVASGISGIWNFAPINLDVNDEVIVSNMNMAQSLASLAHRLYIKKNF